MNKALAYPLALAIMAALALRAGPAQSSPAPPVPAVPQYLALGDSLAVGVGASDPGSTGYVPVFHDFLRDELSCWPPAGPLCRQLNLRNMGVGGATSGTLISDQLPAALAELEGRNGDGSSRNDVGVVTVDIGGNDAFALLTPCAGGLTPACAAAINATFTTFSANFAFTLSELREAAGPDTPIIVMTYYNPLVNASCPFNSLAPLGDIVLEGAPPLGLPVGLNDLIRSIAAIHGAEVADVFGLLGPGDIQPDCLHANDSGYEIIAGEFEDAFAD